MTKNLEMKIASTMTSWAAEGLLVSAEGEAITKDFLLGKITEKEALAKIEEYCKKQDPINA